MILRKQKQEINPIKLKGKNSMNVTLLYSKDIAMSLVNSEDEHEMYVKGAIIDVNYNIGGFESNITDHLEIEFTLEMDKKDLNARAIELLYGSAQTDPDENGIFYLHQVSQGEIFNIEVMS